MLGTAPTPAAFWPLRIGRAEEKRRELEQQQPAAKASAKLLSMLPRAAELCRR